MTRYPQPSDYQMAIQTPKAVFDDPELKSSSVDLNPMRMPVVSSGGFALSFFLTSPTGQKLVVRCFKADSRDRHERYSAISQFLNANPDPIFLDVDYLEKGILVNGNWFPIVRMPRVDGVTLQRYIDLELEAGRSIADLPAKFRKLVDTLEAKVVAHGDLQHGNIMVQKTGELVLIDYDGMYVPSLAGRENPERGHSSYQHRDRDRQFSPNLDRFSSIVIDLGLRAIVADSKLWDRYDNGENILFREADLANPDNSQLLRDLEQNKAVGAKIAAFRALCKGPFDNIPRLTDFIAGKVAPLPLDQMVGRDRTPVLRGTRIYDATDRAELLNHIGEHVVVVGKIVGSKDGYTSFRREPYLFLNFGQYHENALTLVIWADALLRFQQANQKAASYVHQWVQVSGMLTSWASGKTSGIRPQIVIDKPSNIEILTYSEAQQRLGQGQPAPVAQPQPNPQPGPQPPVIVIPPVKPGLTPGLQVSTNRLDYGMVYQGLSAVQSLEIINRSPGSMVIDLGQLPPYVEVKPDYIKCPYNGKVPVQVKLRSDQIPPSLLEQLPRSAGMAGQPYRVKGAAFTIKWGSQVQTIALDAVVVVNAIATASGTGTNRTTVTQPGQPNPTPVVPPPPKPPPVGPPGTPNPAVAPSTAARATSGWRGLFAWLLGAAAIIGTLWLAAAMQGQVQSLYSAEAVDISTPHRAPATAPAPVPPPLSPLASDAVVCPKGLPVQLLTPKDFLMANDVTFRWRAVEALPETCRFVLKVWQENKPRTTVGEVPPKPGRNQEYELPISLPAALPKASQTEGIYGWTVEVAPAGAPEDALPASATPLSFYWIP